MFSRFILSICTLIIVCSLLVQSYQPLSSKIKVVTRTQSSIIENYKIMKYESNFKLFAKPDRKITRDSEDEFFESDVSALI